MNSIIKSLIIIIFIYIYFVADLVSQNIRINDTTNNTLQIIFSKYNNIYNNELKNEIKITPLNEFIKYGFSSPSRKFNVDYCISICRKEDTLINVLMLNIKDYPEFSFIRYHLELKGILRLCYHQYLSDEPINYKYFADSLINRHYYADSIAAFWATADTIDGIYIPKNIDEAILHFRDLFGDSAIVKFKNMSTESIQSLHFGAGLCIRDKWSLWGKSKLWKYFSNLGITSADHISSIILIVMHRHLNNKPIEFKNIINEYKKYYKEDGELKK